MLKPNNRTDMIKPFVSAQPENRTIIEEGLEFAWHDMLTKVEQPYPDLKQPLYTQSEFVSLLAGERGVLDWFPNDNQTQRRETANKAFDIHRKAGTRIGLRESLLPLGIDSVITKGERPYSLVVDGDLLDLPLTPETSQRMNARLLSYKSERDSVEVILSRSNDGAEVKAILVQSTRFINISAAIAKPNFNNLSTRTEQCCLLGFK